MKKSIKNILYAAFAVTLMATSAQACLVGPDPINDPISVNSDGSFENADTKWGKSGRDQLFGGAVIDRSNGKVAQKLTMGNVCYRTEVLVFTDCRSGGSIAFKGLPSDVQVGGRYLETISKLQLPYGPITASGSDTVEGLAQLAKDHGIEFAIRGEPEAEKIGYWKRYPSNFGCNLFYPGSAGASY